MIYPVRVMTTSMTRGVPISQLDLENPPQESSPESGSRYAPIPIRLAPWLSKKVELQPTPLVH